LLFVLAVTPSAQAASRFPTRGEGRLPWHGSGVWLHGDIHVHNLLDRKRRLAIVDAAVEAGLDFIASTEHTDHVFHREPRERLAFLRARHPELILLAGIEWYVPGAGHASVIVEPTASEWRLLRRFGKKFDRVYGAGRRAQPEEGDDADDENHGTWGDLADAEAGLAWLARRGPRGPRSAVYLNHPSRGHLISDAGIARLQAAGLAGIEAGPGHQRLDPPGTPDTIDRYEPWVAVVGGGYDGLLARGADLGLAAGSDFHRTESAYFPGAFSRTLVLAPERTGRGVVQGLASGSTVTVMGGIVRAAWTETLHDGTSDAALIGEVLDVPPGRAVTYRVVLDVPERDSEEKLNHLDGVEIISDCLGAPAVVHTSARLAPGRAVVEYRLPSDARPAACFLRARGRRGVGGAGFAARDADLLFYTGATRLRFGRRGP